MTLKNLKSKKCLYLRKSLKAGSPKPYDVPRKTSEDDDPCGIGWIAPNRKTIELISEKDYLKSDDKKLLKKLSNYPQAKNGFNLLIDDLKKFTLALFNANSLFKEGAAPSDFMLFYTNKLIKKFPHLNISHLENTLESWLIYSLHNSNKKPGDSGYLNLHQFIQNVVRPDRVLDLSPSEGNVCIQAFFNRMIVPITMIILEYNQLNESPIGQSLLKLLNIDDLKRRYQIMETFSWLSISSLRNIYSSLDSENAIQMVLGTSNIDKWEPFLGYFGDCHLLGITTWSKGGGPSNTDKNNQPCGGQGAGWPPFRISNSSLNCYSIFTKDQSTTFLQQGNDLLFRNINKDESFHKKIGAVPNWWAKSNNTISVPLSQIPNFNRSSYPPLKKSPKPLSRSIALLNKASELQNIKSGIYTDNMFFPFDEENCSVCTTSHSTSNSIVTNLANKSTFYIVIGKKAWQAKQNIKLATQQKILNSHGSPTTINKIGGGKALIVNPDSLFGLISKWTGKLTISGPSGTAWLIISTSLLFKNYISRPKPSIPLKSLILTSIISISSFPHHSIYEILLAASAPPINAFPFDINESNKNIIDKYLLAKPISSRSIILPTRSRSDNRSRKVSPRIVSLLKRVQSFPGAGLAG